MKISRKYYSEFFIVLIIAAFAFNGCDDTLTVQDVDNKTIPASNVSFSQHIYPVFQVKCIFCHNATDPDGGLDLTTYSAATADLNVIFPGDPETSRLVWTIEARAGISPMPPIGYRTLTKNQVDGVKTWIREGAKNN